MGPRRRRLQRPGVLAGVLSPTPFRHFSITTAVRPGRLLDNHRWLPPIRRTNEKSLRATATAAVAKKWNDDDGRREIEFVLASARTRTTTTA